MDEVRTIKDILKELAKCYDKLGKLLSEIYEMVN